MSTPVSRLYNFQNDSAAKIPISSQKVDGELDSVISALNRKAIISSTEPSNPIDGQTWVDISQNPPVLKIYDQTNAGWTDATVFGGFDAYPEKESIDNEDLIIINDSEDNNALKNVKVSTIEKEFLSEPVLRVNDTFLKQVDEAGTGTVDLIKAGRNEADDADVAVLPDGVRTETDAAPAEDTDIANKKYVDDQVAIKALGSWVNKSSSYGTQQAETDGFVCAYMQHTSSNIYLMGYTDASQDLVQGGDQSVRRAYCRAGNYGDWTVAANIMFPVKKGDYWRVTINTDTPVVYWIPFGN